MANCCGDDEINGRKREVRRGGGGERGEGLGVGKDELVEKEKENQEGRKWVPRCVGEWLGACVTKNFVG